MRIRPGQKRMREISCTWGEAARGSFHVGSVAGLFYEEEMVNKRPSLLCLSSVLIFDGCSRVHADAAAESPPPTTVVPDVNVTLFSVDHPEQFPVTVAVAHAAAPKLVVTGMVNPDISRNVPVISLATGRVVAIHARLGDTVNKGQLLLSVRSDDVAGGFSDYRKAVADEILARTQLERSKELYDYGAISMNDLQVAEDTEDKAKVDVDTKAEHLRLLGNDPDKPNGIVEVTAPIAGVITDQQVTTAAGVQALGSNPFTISDLSTVWVVGDVYENDLANVRVGETADIRLNAYPDKVITGRISNISAVLDPNIRTAKVRVEVRNTGMMRLGMFATATFSGLKKETYTAVPASAILHIHDRDWVYVPAPGQKFRRIEVVSGDAMPDNMQEIKSGLAPGQQVVANALILEHTINE
jgi:cobalt-zinc-cadmium efflux system membrane fusion protein